MGEKFKKLKRKAWRICWFKSLTAGLALGAFTTGTLRWLSNFKLLPQDILIPYIAGGASAVILWLLFFLLLRPQDARLAKRLDREFELKERLQTMLEFRNASGAMNELQRRDANEALHAVPLGHFKYKRAWIYLSAFLLSASVLATSFVFYPPAEETKPPEKPEIPFEVEDIQLDALKELIESVRTSEMASPYRENVVAILERLLADIPGATTVSKKNELVLTAMEEILEETDASSAAVELIDALWQNEQPGTKSLAKMLNYYVWPRNNPWDKFEKSKNDLHNILLHEDHGNESANADKMFTETRQALTAISAEITTSLIGAKVPQEDPLFLHLTRLSSANETNPDGTRLYGLGTMAEKLESYDAIERELEGTLSILGAEIFHALEGHAANTNTGEGAVTKLASLFGCALPRFERPNLYDASTGDGSGDSTGPSGSIGGGDIIFGSDDIVYDPVSGQYVEYGKIIAEYNRLMLGKLQSGNYSEEERIAIEKYFAILYGGFQKKD